LLKFYLKLGRLMYEVEVFTRFAGLGKKLEPVDVIQVRNLVTFNPTERRAGAHKIAPN
jgi:hypothetical protein